MYSHQRQPRCCLSSMVVSILLLTDFFYGVVSESYLCDCTEVECRAQGQLRCRTDQGCYKEYYNKFDPPISMGCVRSPLYCEHTKMKPVEMENEEWPYTQCCFSELCNRHIQIPENITKNKRISPTTEAPQVPLLPLDVETGVTTTSSEFITNSAQARDDNSESDVHPVFLLLIILVVVFLVVVIASILVIIKIWLYKRQKPVEVKCYTRPSREKTDSYTQTAYLLAYQNSPSPTSIQSHHGLNQPLYDVP